MGQVIADKKKARARIQALQNRRMKAEELHTWAGVLAALGAIGWLMWESVRWLQSGVWEPYRTSFLAPLFDQQWLLSPQSWLGLHKLVIWFLKLPVFLSVPAIIFCGGWCIYALVANDCDERIEKLRKESDFVIEDDSDDV